MLYIRSHSIGSIIKVVVYNRQSKNQNCPLSPTWKSECDIE